MFSVDLCHTDGSIPGIPLGDTALLPEDYIPHWDMIAGQAS
jgi:hypothetical protein